MPPVLPPALLAVLGRLRCSVCGGELVASGRSLRCAGSHAFDVARQGYVNLAVGRRHLLGDTADMVAAREAFLGAGHYLPLAETVADVLGGAGPVEHVVDVGGGTGHHLAVVLDALGGAAGTCLDASAPALRRAARRHPRLAAVGADATAALPLADASVDAVTTVFAPRATAEVRRVLRPGGTWVVVTPRPEHLAELRGPLGTLGVDPRKDERLAAELDGLVDVRARDVVVHRELTLDDVRALVLMGPSAHHVSEPELDARLADLPVPVRVTVAVRVTAATHP